MSRLTTMLEYYVNDEMDAKVPDAHAVAKPSSPSSSASPPLVASVPTVAPASQPIIYIVPAQQPVVQTVHVFHNGVPVTHTYQQQHHYHHHHSEGVGRVVGGGASPVTSSAGQISSASSVVVVPKKEEEGERDLVMGSVLAVMTAAAQFFAVKSFARARRVTRDQEQLLQWARNPLTSKDNAQLAIEAHTLLEPYRVNREWSLVNHGVLVVGIGCGAIACLAPCSALVTPALVIVFGGVLSGATRCALWEFSPHHRTQLRLLKCQVDAIVAAPPATPLASSACMIEPSAPPLPPPPYSPL